MLEIVSGRRSGVIAGLWRFGLGMLTPVYGVAIWFRNKAFDWEWKKVETADVPVISIGNLTTGGTGKTPFVIWVARQLRERDVRVCVLSRGYKAIDGQANDESLELQRAIPDVPVLENPNRVASARLAVEELEMQAILLDDGFQHRRLARDLNVVLIDATNPFGYGRLLPRGLLREPRSALQRADVVVITRVNLVRDDEIGKILTRIVQFVAKENVVVTETVPKRWIRSDGKAFPLEELADQPLLAICGIGNPDGFFSLLAKSGFRVCRKRVFPDHHHFGADDVENVTATARDSGAVSIVCTVKDLVKLERNRIGQFPLYALETGIRFCRGEELLRQKILVLFSESASGV